MDITTFNFYYEADAQHNPNRSVVWTDAYTDPAGQGWMVSTIEPVYNGDFLEGVTGLDVTATTLVDQVLKMQIPWSGYGILVSRTGAIMALSPEGEADFGRGGQDLFNRTDLGDLPRTVQQRASGITPAVLNGEGKQVAWNTVAATGWKLVIVVRDSAIQAQALDLSHRISTLLYVMIGAITLFYICFFLYLYRQARRMSLDIAQPLTSINDIVRQIGHGNYNQAIKPAAVLELDETSRGLVQMGKRLDEKRAALLLTQEQLRAAKEEAEAAAKAKTQFLATMSHEIRTPMNGVLGMTELLSDTRLTPTQKEYADIISVSAKSLLSIIDDILNYAKVEAGKTVLVDDEFGLLNLLEGVLDMLAPSAQAKKLELVLRMPAGVPERVIGDQDRLRQVLVNLLGNAIKFSDVGQAVTSVSIAEETDESVLLRFEVRDSGIGIRPEDQPKIFDVFQQVDGSSTRRHGGTGLGLAISRELVRLFGGAIGVESEFGAGSVFWFTARLKKTAQALGIFERQKAQMECLNGKRILVVDDNEVARSALVEWLETCEPARIDQAGKGMDGLKMALEKDYDAVLLDRDMPDVSGMEVIDEVAKARDSSRRSAPPFVLMMPVGTIPKLLEFPKGTVVWPVHKPLHRHSLLAALDEMFRGGHSPTEDTAPVTPISSKDKPIDSEPSSPFQVLLAEDNPTNRKVAERMLGMLGCQVTSVENGLLAVDAVQQRRFDLVLMDCQMPEMDGYTATREIRRWEAEQGRDRMRIVALTANVLATDREKALESGMDQHVPKPIRKADLRQLCRH